MKFWERLMAPFRAPGGMDKELDHLDEVLREYELDRDRTLLRLSAVVDRCKHQETGKPANDE